MELNSVLHILSLSSVFISIIAIITRFINKSYSFFLKINSIVYLLLIGVTPLLSEFLLNFVQSYQKLYIEYNTRITIISVIINIAGLLLIIIGNLIKSDKLQSKAYRIYELASLVVYIALIYNLFSSNKESVFISPILFLALIFNTCCNVNLTEKLNDKISKILYFLTNSLLALFFVVSIIMLTLTNTFSINLQFITILVITIILSACGFVCGILEIKRNKN